MRSLRQSAREAWAKPIARRTPGKGRIIETVCAAILFRCDVAAGSARNALQNFRGLKRGPLEPMNPVSTE